MVMIFLFKLNPDVFYIMQSTAKEIDRTALYMFEIHNPDSKLFFITALHSTLAYTVTSV